MQQQASTTSGAMTIDQAVSDVLAEIEQARAAETFTQSQMDVMRSRVQLGAVVAYTEALGAITRSCSDVVIAAPAAVEVAQRALVAAQAEGTRLLALLGVELPVLPAPDSGSN